VDGIIEPIDPTTKISRPNKPTKIDVTKQTITSDCDNIENIDWKNKDKTIKIYEACINYEKEKPTDNNTKQKYLYNRLVEQQTDARLYLSYVYLTQTDYQNVEKANLLLNEAVEEMKSKCDGWQGPRSNFCYMQNSEYSIDKIPEKFNNLSDALHLYHMTLPCVYVDMIKEQPETLKLIEGYFGSNRDNFIPRICDDVGPDEIFMMHDLEKMGNYKHVAELNTSATGEGTIRFAYYRANYKKAAELLIFPEESLRDMNPDEVFVSLKIGGETPMARNYYFKDIENELYKHQDLVNKYEEIIKSVKNYYLNDLNLPSDIAEKYAKVAVQTLMLYRLYNQW
jgi:hypothetical protein